VKGVRKDQNVALSGENEKRMWREKVKRVFTVFGVLERKEYQKGLAGCN
jgi:hypothetical protein